MQVDVKQHFVKLAYFITNSTLTLLDYADNLKWLWSKWLEMPTIRTAP
jgi:hypothetical protein